MHEMGVRMALGAEGRDVLRLVLARGVGLAGLGVVLGLAGAVALTRLLSSLLYGVRPVDPAVFAAVALVLIGTAVVASWIPGRRAARADPVRALRAG